MLQIAFEGNVFPTIMEQHLFAMIQYEPPEKCDKRLGHN